MEDNNNLEIKEKDDLLNPLNESVTNNVSKFKYDVISSHRDWEIHGFSALLAAIKDRDVPHYTQTQFAMHGAIWTATLWPYANGRKLQEHLSFYLRLHASANMQPLTARMTLIIVNRTNPAENIEVRMRSNLFEPSIDSTATQAAYSTVESNQLFSEGGEKDNIGKPWGFKVVVTHHTLLTKTGFLTDDKLSMKVTIELVNFERNHTGPLELGARRAHVHTQLLQNDLIQRLNAKAGDIKIELQDGQHLMVDEVVLSARSAVFRGMFLHPMQEEKYRTLDLKHLKPDVVKYFIQYLYDGRLPRPLLFVKTRSMNTIQELYETAHLYDVQALVDACREALLQQISIHNVIQMFALSETFHDTVLRHYLRLFYIEHVDLIIQSQITHYLTSSLPPSTSTCSSKKRRL